MYPRNKGPLVAAGDATHKAQGAEYRVPGYF
jgi:hypothetical protein